MRLRSAPRAVQEVSSTVEFRVSQNRSGMILHVCEGTSAHDRGPGRPGPGGRSGARAARGRTLAGAVSVPVAAVPDDSNRKLKVNTTGLLGTLEIHVLNFRCQQAVFLPQLSVMSPCPRLFQLPGTPASLAGGPAAHRQGQQPRSFPWMVALTALSLTLSPFSAAVVMSLCLTLTVLLPLYKGPVLGAAHPGAEDK